MKIAFLMHSFYEINVGGAEYQAYLIAENIAKLGFSNAFIFLKRKDQFCSNYNGFALHPITKVSNKKIAPLKLIYSIQIIKYLRKINPDIIYHRNFSSFLFSAHMYRLLFNKKTKVVFHVAHDHDTEKYRPSLRPSKLLKTLDDLFGKMSLFFTRNIIVQTYHQKTKMFQNFSRESKLIRNFGEPHQSCTTSKKENIILWIANIKETKNPSDFIRLANELKHTGYRFLMIGKPPTSRFKSTFDSQLKGSNVEYLKQLDNNDINRLLCRSKLLCCTSFAEGFSNTFIQAWFRNVPVVSLYVDPDGLINAHRLGRHSKTFPNLKKDILSLMTDEGKLEEMAKRVRQFAEKHLSIDSNIGKLTTYLNELR